MAAFRPFLKFIFRNHNIRRCVLCLAESTSLYKSCNQ